MHSDCLAWEDKEESGNSLINLSDMGRSSAALSKRFEVHIY